MMAYTIKTVPAKITIKRFTREKVHPDDPLMPEWAPVWSQWVLAMTPYKHDDNFRRRATKQYDRPGYKLTKTKLQEQFGDQNPCGIYEWKARHTGTKEAYVVYIGSTCRSKNGNFIDRIWEYCTNGSHKDYFIDHALKNRYELLVRYKGSGDNTAASLQNKESAECDENTVLKNFDYAWNIRSVKEIRNLPYC